MKKVFLVFPIIFSLILLGCSQPSGDDGGGNLSVKISNQSSIDLYGVTWNGISFAGQDPNLDQYLDLGLDPNNLPPELRYDTLPISAYMTASSPLSGVEAGASGYVFFETAYYVYPVYGGRLHTQEILSLDDKPVVFTITDDTIVVAAGGKSGPLGTIVNWYQR
jgi:hypothetical protein